MEAIIEYVNVPQNKILGNDNLTSLTFDLQANRFEAMYYSAKTPIISIDVSTYLVSSKKKAIVDKAILENLILIQLNKNLTLRNISVNQLEIDLDDIETKKVPIKTITDITFKNGFDGVGPAKISPDSILLRGPLKLLDSISEISTVRLKRDNIDKTLKLKIPLNPLKSNDVFMDETSITYTLNVEEFSQKIVSVPVKLINAPQSGSVKLIPNRVEIDFTVSMSLFNEITAEDFKVVCDYANRNFEENFMIPEIVTFPKQIKDAELTTKKIDFLIFK